MTTTLIILIISAIFFMVGKVRSDLVALCALLALVLSGILTPEEALSGFSNSVVIMMAGLFVVSGAIFQTGLAKKVSGYILRVAGTSELRLFLLVMLVTAFIGSFVSNTGTVALMLPIVVSMAKTAKVSPARLLMPLAFASSMGGMTTLIGTAPNLIISDTLAHAGFERLSFFSFTPVGLICVVTGTLLLIPLTRLFLPGQRSRKNENRSGKSLNQLVEEYQLAEGLTRLSIPVGSLAIGKTVTELDVFRRYGLTVIEVRREKSASGPLLKRINQFMANRDVVLSAGDVLYVIAQDVSKAEAFAEDYGLETVVRQNDGGKLHFYHLGIAEIVLLPVSKLLNRTLKEVEFRTTYGVSVLGIRRGKHYLLDQLKDERLHNGDVLLVQGTWENIARLEKTGGNEWVIIGQPQDEAARVTLDYKAPVAALIMVLMIVAMAFDSIPIAPVTAVMLAAVFMVITGCLRNVEAAYKTMNWESLVLFAAMLPMSIALEKTGASAWVSDSLIVGLGSYGPYVLLAGIYFATSLLTMFISNTVTTVLMAPIALTAALGIDAHPTAFLFAVSVAASMCFASPFSTPPNALVMPAGQYKFSDFVKVGLPLQLAMGLVMVFTLPLLFPF